VVPTADPDPGPRTTGEPTDTQVTEAVLRWLDMVGLDPETVTDRLVLSPACGLAGASPAWARRALGLVRDAAGHLSG